MAQSGAKSHIRHLRHFAAIQAARPLVSSVGGAAFSSLSSRRTARRHAATSASRPSAKAARDIAHPRKTRAPASAHLTDNASAKFRHGQAFIVVNHSPTRRVAERGFPKLASAAQ